MALPNEKLNIETPNDPEDPDESSQVVSRLELDEDEVNTLFNIISKGDAKTFNKIVVNNLLVMDAAGKYARCSLHESLLFFQQLENQRLSLSGYPLHYPSMPGNYSGAQNVVVIYPRKFRIKLVAKVIQFIDTYSTRMVSEQHDCTDKCIICMVHFQLNDKLRKLKCSHTFHCICVDRWLVKSYTCPLCRTDLMGTGKHYTCLSVVDSHSGW